MQQIKQDAHVIVLTGYPDSQLHYQGFEATVVEVEGSKYKVRDNTGRLYDCKANELVLMDEKDQALHH